MIKTTIYVINSKEWRDLRGLIEGKYRIINRMDNKSSIFDEKIGNIGDIMYEKGDVQIATKKGSVLEEVIENFSPERT